jgi:uncharacterized membrane protein YvbJ
MKNYLMLACLLSGNLWAGYECDFSLAHSENLHEVIATKKIKSTNSEMRSFSVKDFFIESKNKSSKMVSLSLNIFIDGWKGEEEASVAVFRRFQKRSNVEMDLLSDKVSLRGNAQDTLWFDNYKLDVKCALN